MGWWELRRYYMLCIVQMYTKAIGPLIGFSIMAVAVLFFIVFLFVVSSIQNDYWDCLIMGIFAVVVIDFMLLMVQNAVSYHKKQLEHVLAIRQRLLEVQRNELDGQYTIDERTSRLYPEIVESVIRDMEQNYDAVRVFGIRVDVNFMIFLRGIISALVVALGGALAQEIT